MKYLGKSLIKYVWSLYVKNIAKIIEIIQRLK